MLPMIAFAATLVYLDYVRDRDDAFDTVLQTIRGVRLELDREIQETTARLQVLALSPALQRGDFAAFHAELQTYLKQFPGTSVLSLADASGRQIINTRRPADTALPPRGNMEALEQVFRTNRPAYSKLFTGNVSREPLLTVQVPVLKDGQVIYDLATAVPIGNFQQLLRDQNLGPQWTLAIFDQSGTNFARLPNPEQTVGKRASPSLMNELFKNRESKLITTTLEGVELITAVSQSPVSGWAVAGGIPTAVIAQPLWRNLAITIAIGSLLLATGLAFALRMASRIAHGEKLHALLINELNHRVKNTLASVQSVAALTFRNAADPAEAVAKFNSRLVALGQVHNVLSEEKWEGANVRQIVDRTLDPYVVRDSRRLHVSGPEVRVAPRCALLVSMALHELATNASKYGALSGDTGDIHIDWTVSEADMRKLRLSWRESGGPQIVAAPTRRGFGSRLIEQSFSEQIHGKATLEFKPSGVVCTLECAID
ncbi:MAG: sensor histidine kinase [Pseudolabrys sp.]|nr:sensor histidine kinase [Pseudolabrys sp.]MBV9955087.1 sensor histidine kinase [Pseudolabrys sp.]